MHQKALHLLTVVLGLGLWTIHPATCAAQSSLASPAGTLVGAWWPRFDAPRDFPELTKQDILAHNPRVAPKSKVRVDLTPSCTRRHTVEEGHWFLGEKDKAEFEAVQDLIQMHHLHDVFRIEYDIDNEQILIVTVPSFQDYAAMQERLESFEIPIFVRPACRTQSGMLDFLHEIRAFIKTHDFFHELMLSGIESTSSKPMIWVKPFGYALKEKIEARYKDAVIVTFFDPDRD